MITYKKQPIPLSKVAEKLAMFFVETDDYKVNSHEYRINIDYAKNNPEYAIKWMFENTKPCDFGLSFDKWESLEDFEIKKGEN